MFEWLVEEMASVKTRKFFIVDGLFPPDERNCVEESELAVPPSYKAFVIQFGNAKLYRSIIDHYYVQVFGSLRVAGKHDMSLLLFGRANESLAYFREELLVPGEETPVFESRYKQELEFRHPTFWNFTNGIDGCAKMTSVYFGVFWERVREEPFFGRLGPRQR